MPQSLAKVLLHVVFSTKNREPILCDRRVREELHRYVAGILGKLDCQPLIAGGVEDHVHLLFVLSRTMPISEVIKEAKRASSVWMKQKGPEFGAFAWQSGYGAFSIGASQVETVRAYIADQEKHHQKLSFQDEFLELLRRYQIEHDERYVWD